MNDPIAANQSKHVGDDGKLRYDADGSEVFPGATGVRKPPTYKWEGAGTPLPDGHTIIETHDNGHGETAWAIFDQSGNRPENTDDGVLWLDPTRCLAIINDGSRIEHDWTEVIHIPIQNENGDRIATPSDAATILLLSRMLRWTISVNDVHFYNVR